MKYQPKSPIVTSDNYQVMLTEYLKRLFILSKQMFEVSTSIFTQPYMPLVNCLVDDMLLQTRPCSNQVPLHISNIDYWHPVDMLPHDAPDFIVHWIEVGLFGGHRSDLPKAGA